MLTAHQLTKSYGLHTVLKDISLNISARDRIGLIGPNGCGKTTLLRILAGLDKPEKGNVIYTRSDLRIGYLPQGFKFSPGESIGHSLGLSDPGQEISSMEDLTTEIASLAEALARVPDDPGLQNHYDDCLSRFAIFNSHPQAILGPLGLAEFALDTPINHLSGGQKTRLMLARVLLNNPNLLLLDEPTNHLDIGMLEWLEAWLNAFSGATLIVSHDRAFLDNTINSLLELEPTTESLRSYPGNYSAYLEQKLNEHEHLLQAFSDQQVQLEQLRAAAQHLRGLTRMKKGGKADGGDKFAKGYFGNRATKNTAGRAKHIEARIEKILNQDHIEKPRPSWQLKLDFGAPAHRSKEVVVAEDLTVGYPGHPAILNGLNFNLRDGQRIAMTGPNGSGKTTLMRTIAGILPPISGTIKTGANIRTGYMSQEQEMLNPALSPLQSIQNCSDFNQTEARHFLHFFLFADEEPLRPIGEMSYGERARLQLALLVAGGCTFLLLDEPINHLDIPSRTRFEQALAKFKGTVLTVVHDRYFIESFATDVWSLENGQIKKW